MITLQKPCMRYKQSYLLAQEELEVAESLNFDPVASVEEYIRGLDLEARGIVKDGRVPQTTYWMVANEEFMGRISLRHFLNPDLVKWGGHIGYIVRPSARRKGYGKRALQLCLQEAKRLGLVRVLLTCYECNVASAKIIEANGGQWVDTQQWEGHPDATRRYWIDLV